MRVLVIFRCNAQSQPERQALPECQHQVSFKSQLQFNFSLAFLYRFGLIPIYNNTALDSNVILLYFPVIRIALFLIYPRYKYALREVIHPWTHFIFSTIFRTFRLFFQFFLYFVLLALFLFCRTTIHLNSKCPTHENSHSCVRYFNLSGTLLPYELVLSLLLVFIYFLIKWRAVTIARCLRGFKFSQ